MALPVIANVWRVAFLYLRGAQRAVNVMHYQSAAPDEATLHAAIGAAWQANQLQMLTTSAILTSASYTKLDGIRPTVTLNFTGTKFTGQQAGDFIPSVAQVVSLYTSQRGRRSRGRVYLPFTSETAMQQGTLDPVMVPAVQTAWEAYRAALLAAGHPLQVTSYGWEGSPDRPAFAPNSLGVTAVTVRSVAGTQRKRQDRLRV